MRRKGNTRTSNAVTSRSRLDPFQKKRKEFVPRTLSENNSNDITKAKTGNNDKNKNNYLFVFAVILTKNIPFNGWQT